LLGRAHGDDEPDPTPHFPFPQNGHGMADRLDFEGESKDRRVQATEQAVRNRGFLFQHPLELTHVHFPAGDHFEQSHMVQAAGRNFAADDDFGPAEKISLKISESHLTSLMKLVGRFQFLRQHRALRGAKPAHHASSFLQLGGPDVDFYGVGKLAKRQPWIVGREVIEGDKIAGRFQTLAGVLGLDRLQNLGHGLAGGGVT
jgi:hypothetical protein